jgi:hypothetical protein
MAKRKIRSEAGRACGREAAAKKSAQSLARWAVAPHRLSVAARVGSTNLARSTVGRHRRSTSGGSLSRRARVLALIAVRDADGAEPLLAVEGGAFIGAMSWKGEGEIGSRARPLRAYRRSISRR